MENKETIINVNEIIHKVGKTSGNPYQLIKTNLGDMTCFETEILSKLQEAKTQNKSAKVIVAENEKDGRVFKNIREFKSFGDKTEIKETESNNSVEVETIKPEKFAKERNDKLTSIYTSYVKDLVVSGKKVEEAIEIIKQARKEFD